MKVRELLTPLKMDQLKRLCEIRGQSVIGKIAKLRERLARSYRGNVERVVQDLRREDLLVIGDRFDGQLKLRPGWRQLKVKQMRRAFTEATNENAQFSSQSLEESLTLYSSQFNGSSTIDYLNYKQLQKDVKGAKRVTVITAYYGTDMLEKLLNECRGEVRVVVNGLGGKRLLKQIEGLEDLTKKLRANAYKVKVKLGFSEGIFHPKLYLFEHPTNAAVWIGSANATAAALRGHNEEILIRISSIPESVAEYAAHVWEKAQPLDKDVVAPVNSLIAFFRTGRLYYKPYALLPKTINPFRKMISELPEDERRKISKFNFKFADSEGGIGAFNIGLMFEEHHREDKETTESRTGENGRVRFRPYAIETTYGYWVSEKFIDKVDKMLVKASRHKEGELKRFQEWLSQSEDNIVAIYREYLDVAINTLKDENVKYPSKYQYLFEDPEPSLKLIDKLTRLLTNKGQFRRYHLEFVSSELPEMWEDVSSWEAFEDSFFEWLAAMSSPSRQRRPKSAATILDAIDITWRGASAEDIRKELKRRLADRKEQWYYKVFLLED